MQEYLLIQNKNEAPVESFTVLGCSSTRNYQSVGLRIGQFGTGTKHATNLLVREGMGLRVYCGRTRLDFAWEEDTFKDDTVHHMVFRKNNTGNWRRLNWTLTWGSIDWDNKWMAIREYISNAIDETLAEVDHDNDVECRRLHKEALAAAMESGDLCVRVVPESEVKAKAGYTRVYIKCDDEIRELFGILPKRFLHWQNLDLLDQTLIPSSNAEFPNVYRQGVFVATLEEGKKESIYDYNFTPREIRIDDCRNSNAFLLRMACAKALKRAPAERLVPVLRDAIGSAESFEVTKLDGDYLSPEWNDNTEQLEAKWQDAWKVVAGDAVACETAAPVVDFVKRTGRSPVTVKSEPIMRAIRATKVPNAGQLLEAAGDHAGKEPVPTTEAAVRAVAKVWNWVEASGKTNDKSMPDVRCYKDLMHAESETMGYADDEAVYIREDIASGENDFLTKVALEEVAHYVTGAGDRSRDIQSYLIDMIVGIAE